MKTLFTLIAFAASCLTLNAGETPKKVTLEGTGMCAKCTLSEADSCTNALQVKDSNGDLKTYIFTANMKHGDYFCQGKTKDVVVKGTLVEKDGKLLLTPSSVEKKES